MLLSAGSLVVLDELDELSVELDELSELSVLDVTSELSGGSLSGDFPALAAIAMITIISSNNAPPAIARYILLLVSFFKSKRFCLFTEIGKSLLSSCSRKPFASSSA